MNRLLLPLLVLGISHAALAQEWKTSVENTRYIAHYQDVLDIASLQVLIYGKKPRPRTTEAVLRANLQSAIALYDGKDILATAWHIQGDEEEQLKLTDRSDSLMYVAKEKRIKTWKEYEGIATKTTKGKGYTVEYEERDILVPPRGRKFATVNVLFDKRPSVDKAYPILVAELRKAVAKQGRKWDTTAYAYVGKERQQLLAGKFGVVVEYSAETGKMTSPDGKSFGSVDD